MVGFLPKICTMQIFFQGVISFPVLLVQTILSYFKSVFTSVIIDGIILHHAKGIQSGRADYETGIKPASHRVTNYAPSVPTSHAPSPLPPANHASSPITHSKSVGSFPRLKSDSPKSTAPKYIHRNESVENSVLYQTALEDVPAEAQKTALSSPAKFPVNPGRGSRGQPPASAKYAPSSEALKWAEGPSKSRRVNLLGSHVCSKPLPTYQSLQEPSSRYGAQSETRLLGWLEAGHPMLGAGHQRLEAGHPGHPGLARIEEDSRARFATGLFQRIQRRKDPDPGSRSSLLRGTFLSLWTRKPEEGTVKSSQEPESPPRADWNLGEDGVKGIVSSLESAAVPTTEKFTTAQQLESTQSTPGQTSQGEKTHPSVYRTTSSGSSGSYQSPAEKVSDILRRPLPSHNPRKLRIPQKEPAPGAAWGQSGRNRLSCNLEDLRSIAAIKQAHSLLDTDPSLVDNQRENLVPQPEIHTARIIQAPTQKPKLQSVKTSTPLEIRTKSDNLSKRKGMQQAFRTALEEAATDLSDESSAKRTERPGEGRIHVDKRSSKDPQQNRHFSSILPNSPNYTASQSREHYLSAMDGESGPHSIMTTEPGVGAGGEPRRTSNTEKCEDESTMGKRSRLSRYSSGRSSMSGCSLPETEDLYCDDELHPSLENDPNMQLFTAALLHHNLHEIDDTPIFQSLDGESVLSMEIPSTGPHSLRSEYTDTEIQEIEERIQRTAAEVTESGEAAWVDDDEDDQASNQDTEKIDISLEDDVVGDSTVWFTQDVTSITEDDLEAEDLCHDIPVTPVRQPQPPSGVLVTSVNHQQAVST